MAKEERNEGAPRSMERPAGSGDEPEKECRESRADLDF